MWGFLYCDETGYAEHKSFCIELSINIITNPLMCSGDSHTREENYIVLVCSMT